MSVLHDKADLQVEGTKESTHLINSTPLYEIHTTNTHAHIHTHAHARAHARTHARTLTHARTHSHTNMRTHTHTHTRTHAHTHFQKSHPFIKIHTKLGSCQPRTPGKVRFPGTMASAEQAPEAWPSTRRSTDYGTSHTSSHTHYHYHTHILTPPPPPLYTHKKTQPLVL